MWQNGNRGIYLEPGEVAVLAEAVVRAVPPGPAAHPGALMLRALADALAGLVEGSGLLLAPAPADVARGAALALLQAPAAPLPVTPRRPA